MWPQNLEQETSEMHKAEVGRYVKKAREKTKALQYPVTQ